MSRKRAFEIMSRKRAFEIMSRCTLSAQAAFDLKVGFDRLVPMRPCPLPPTAGELPSAHLQASYA
eukprot:6214509-Pleurochrysis_carterae.AAC.6